MKLAVISGKGGTGKTIAALALARLASERGLRTTLVDADLETPNADLLLRVVWRTETRVWHPIPHLHADRCRNCGACSDFCSSQALVKTPKRLLVFPELCRSCGGCYRVCPSQALLPESGSIGTWRQGTADCGLHVIQGRLDVGQTAIHSLLKETLAQASSLAGALAIIDGPSATHAILHQILRSADRALFIAEPTQFGKRDLEKTSRAARDRALPFSVLLNRTGAEEPAMEAWCDEHEIPLWGKIPDDPRIIQALADPSPFGRSTNGARDVLDGILTRLIRVPGPGTQQ